LWIVGQAGCSDDDDKVVLDPIENLIAHDGGSTGGVHLGEVTVVAFDKITHEPIAAALVSVDDSSASLHQLDTGDDGKALFSGLQPVPLTVTIVKDGYANLTIVGISAKIMAFPLNRRRRLQLQGTVNGAAGAGTTLTLEFETTLESAFSGTSYKYGTVEQGPTGATPTYIVHFDQGAQDTLVFTETDNVTGRILNIQRLPIGPYTADQAGLDITFDGTTGMHEVSGTISNLPGDVSGVALDCYQGDDVYAAYRFTGTGSTRTYYVQVPPDSSFEAVVLVDRTGNFTGTPQEGQEFTLSSLGPDNITPTQVNLALDMVTLSGSFLNYGGSIAATVVLKYGRVEAAVSALPSAGYSIRLPRDLYARGAAGTYVGVTFTLDRAKEFDAGPFDADATLDIDFNQATPWQTTITTNLPDGITSHSSEALMISAYPDGETAYPAYLRSGTVSASDISFNLVYGLRHGHAWACILADDDNLSTASSIYVRTGFAEPDQLLGSTLSLTLLDVHTNLSPAGGSNEASSLVTFSWNSMAPTLTDEGLIALKIEENVSGEVVWIIHLQYEKTQITLPNLGATAASLILQSGITYRWELSALERSGFHINEFTIDMFPTDDFSLFDQEMILKVSEAPSRTFSVN
jgi:hypothetical protein